MIQKSFKILFYIIGCCILLFTYSCKQKVTSAEEDPALIKVVTGYATATSIHVSQKLYTEPLPPNNATYSDGWWLFNADLPNGQLNQGKVQFWDASETIQKDFDPDTIAENACTTSHPAFIATTFSYHWSTFTGNGTFINTCDTFVYCTVSWDDIPRGN